MKKLLAALLGLVLMVGITVFNTLPVQAACQPEPFAGDVHHDSTSKRTNMPIQVDGKNYGLARGQKSDNILSGCKDVDFVYLPGGYNLQRHNNSITGPWSTWATSTGWHKIGTANLRLRYVNE